MRKQLLLLKTLLVTVLMGVGTSVSWADATVAFSQDFTAKGESTDPADYGFTMTTYNSGAATVTGGLLQYSLPANNNKDVSAWGVASFSAIPTGNVVTVSCSWNPGGPTGMRPYSTLRVYGSNGTEDKVIFSLYNQGQNKQLLLRSYDAEAGNANVLASGDNWRSGSIVWNVVAVLNISTQKVVSLTVTKSGESTPVVSQENIAFENEVVNINKFEFGTNKKSNGEVTSTLDNVSITYEAAASVANVTFKYEDTDGNDLSSLKADVVESNDVDASIEDIITSALKASFYNGDESIRYDYSTYTCSDATVPEGGTTVTLKFTPKAKYAYSVNAIDGEDGIIKANIISGTCYANETASFYLPSCVLVDGTLYFMTAEASYKSETVTSNNQVFSYAYTASTVDNVVFYAEGEDISGASTSSPNTNLKYLASCGNMGRGSNLSVTTLPAGAYTVYVHYINTNSGAHSLLVKAGDVDVINATDVTGRPTKNGSVSLSESTAITLTAAGSSTSGVDYIYIVQTAVAAPVSEFGKSTFSSTYPVDIANATPAGLKAYKATAADASSVHMVEVTEAVAGMTGNNKTGLLLVGTPSTTYYIPIATTSGSEPSGNLLFGWNSSWGNLGVADSGTNFVLSVQNDEVVWAPIKSATAPLATGQAGLWADVEINTSRSLRMVFGDNSVTGISDATRLKEKGQMTNGVFNLNGQRVKKAAKGLYIVNGKKYIK